jgi:hypothetical protein
MGQHIASFMSWRAPAASRLIETRSGTYRVVVLIRRWALKLPRVRHFGAGLLANRRERMLARTGWPQLCPVLLADPLGLFLVMRRTRPLTDKEWADLGPFGVVDLFTRSVEIIPGEAKRSSVGVLDDGRVVIIDYVDH